MPCRHGETGIRNRLKIGLFGLRVRFPLAALSETRLECRVFLFFQRFPHGSQFTAIHCKSLQLPEKCGQNVGTDGHGSPDHRQVEALARPPFHRQILLVVAKQQQVSGGVSVPRMFQLLDYAPVLQGGD